MAALTPGTTAPGILLKDSEGKTVSLAEALKKGPVLAAFFKVTCPTCQFTLPFLQRMYQMYGGGSVTFLGISQNDERDTREFMREFGTEFQVLIDDRGYPTSKQYGLTNVPSLFWIAPDGNIRATSIGFVKADLQRIASEAARAAGKAEQPLFKPGEVIPEYKPG
ncbi:MAG TPA: TlpA disulfide reductase family protein [Candidatus Acidoferrales bacterium]|nr:TlpA disulfide reductase family protein [Candidatus Acidoferrales bacterium]